MKRKVLIVAAVLFTVVGSAAAQSDRQVSDAAGKLADELAACRAIGEDAARLRCFDRASAALIAARDAGDLVVLDREGMRRAKRAVFGFSLPKIKLFGDGPGRREEPEVREIDSTLASVRPLANGLHLFVLADDTQWQTVEARTGFFPRAGKPIKIEAGLLGSYNARVDGGRGMKVKRVR